MLHEHSAAERFGPPLDGVDATIRFLHGMTSRLRVKSRHLLASKVRSAPRDEVHATSRLASGMQPAPNVYLYRLCRLGWLPAWQ